MGYVPSEHFKAAADYLFGSSSLAKVSNEVKLELYALYKCITVSKTPSTSRPSVFDFAGRAKWDAWNNLGNQNHGSDPPLLEERYVEIARSLGWKDDVQQALSGSNETVSEGDEFGGSSGRSGGMGAAVSTMSQLPPDPKDEGTLHAFALANDTEGLLSFLNSRPETDINLRDDYGYTPLHLAADRGNTNVVKLLIAKGADANIQDSEEFTAHALAEIGGHQDVINILLAHSTN